MNNWIYIAVMFAVSYAIRILPLTLIRKPIENQFIQSFLYYVPYVTLAVMTFPAIVNATQSPIAGAAALVVGIIAAWMGAGLFPVSVLCCAVVLVLSVMGVQPVALPTVVLSTHTGGFGTPARLDGCDYGMAALEHYRELGLEFDCIYTGYLGGEAQAAIAEKAFDLWPAAKKVVDPVMGDNGKAYSTVTPEFIDRMRTLCQRADLILPNVTEAGLLLRKETLPENFDEAGAQALADELTTLAPDAIVTGVAMGKYIGCAGAGRDRFVIKKLHIERSFPGTGDLYGAVLIGSLIQGNVMSAAADNAAEFVSLAIQKTPADQDTRFGVWFEPLLPRLCPLRDL